MKAHLPLLQFFLTDESGQDLIEYALVAALIGLAAIAVLQTVATSLSTAYTSITSTISAAV